MTTTINNGRDSPDEVTNWALHLRLFFVSLMLVLCGVMMQLVTTSSSRYWASRQAMLQDPALPFAAWDRAIAQAPTEAQRKGLKGAKSTVMYYFEKPFFDLCTTSHCSFFTERRNEWAFGHQAPQVLYQTLGGDAAYQRALASERQEAQKESVEQANLVQALNAMTKVGP